MQPQFIAAFSIDNACNPTGWDGAVQGGAKALRQFTEAAENGMHWDWPALKRMGVNGFEVRHSRRSHVKIRIFRWQFDGKRQSRKAVNGEISAS